MLNKFNHTLWLVAMLLVCVATNCFAQTDFSEFEIKQGKGEFSQAKQFTFLKRAIKSQGEFVIFQQQVYWHTLSPVKSELLVLADGIYRRNDAEQDYQVLTQDKQINQLLAKLLSGQIQSSDWQITALEQTRCYQLVPTLTEVAQMFKQVKLCRNGDSQREIVITDQQNNNTNITMKIITKELTQGDMDAVKLTH
ncbi:outer membrane lipoprotein carrier protein LolA [Pseudoalteromonas shioyasakiensis]|uniref:outer membrane lipoprotein carrier protein LolA n=1 Tax=Pseudoalteromonas shioyasakiensis TaxID=1190813 RepID=UPI0021185FD6|nr:outer membrane lipoprotein carrier protein LolA [Pseudoalteromonas shioyasakiensis]MCQ8878449.1 outer membrane lipoprotein carrier protein LolA [Pseudoalteromonas shioyasakiensis]